MTENKDFLLSSYNYALDQDRIAQYPLHPRHSSKLFIVGGIDDLSSRHLTVWNWQDELRPGDLIILNDTRVIKARLRVRRYGGGIGELLILESKGQGKWLCLVKPGKRMREGDVLSLEAPARKSLNLRVLSIDEQTGGRVIKFPSSFFDLNTLQNLLEEYGEIPLPPYIESHQGSNQDTYQTTYASKLGAVAAPTAGLHLSRELLQALHEKGVLQAKVTLHIGLGTFKPLGNESLTNLELHREWVEVQKEVVEAIEACRLRGGRVIAVGTTTVRALEGAFAASQGKLVPFKGMIDLVIKPGYRFRVIDGLLTNFHLPKSSLLLLVSALIGRKRLLKLYKEAIELNYRFFSYGDAMWIPPEAVLPKSRPSS